MDQKPALLSNRSIPAIAVIPVLRYPDVETAVEWLTEGLGFVEHVRIGDHRSQLSFGDGALVVAAAEDAMPNDAHEVMLRVADVDAAVHTAAEYGASVQAAPQDFPYGERQARLVDFAGHHWTLSQSVSDQKPEEWGGRTVRPR